MPEFKSMRAGYRNLWSHAGVTRTDAAIKVAAGILKDRSRYEAIRMNVPWFWIAITHHRESNRDFRAVLHNGQKIIGTGKKTTIVPKGRGPFATFEEAAVDALKGHRLDRITDWPIERMLYEFERWNGWGYLGRVNSPYVWAGTNMQQRGKYVADGRFDPNHWDQQLGCAAILKELARLDEGIAERVGGAVTEDVLAPTKPPVDVTTTDWGGIIVFILKALASLFGSKK